MITSVTSQEQLAEVSSQALKVFTDKRRSLGRSPSPVGSGEAEGDLFFDEAIFERVGLLNPDGTFTESGNSAARVIKNPLHRIEIREISAASHRGFSLYIGEEEDIVFASRGAEEDGYIFSRTTLESSLHHLYAWLNFPVYMQDSNHQKRTFPALILNHQKSLKELGRVWEIASDLLSEKVVIGSFDHSLWILDEYQGEGDKAEIIFSSHDTLALNLLVHHFWAAVHGGTPWQDVIWN